MLRRARAFVLLSVLAVATGLATGADPLGSGTLDWRAASDRVDAAIESWPLPRVIATISSATGWQTYVEPGTAHAVTARFQNLDATAALRRLLGELNFALLPQVTGPAKLFVFRHSIADATGFVQAANTRPKAAPDRAMTNELIVTRRRGATGDVNRLAERLGARVVGRIDGIDAYRLAFDDDARARGARRVLAGDDEIESVEANVAIPRPENLIPITASPVPPFSLQRDVSPSSGEVVVALIDTAVQAEGSSIKALLREGVSLYGDYQPPQNHLTHGTAMANTILDGVARALLERNGSSTGVPLSILPVDVYGANESTTTFDVAWGLSEALDRHVNVVNLSLTGDTDSPLLRRLIQQAARQGVLFFAAAGNEPVTVPTFPAADPGVVSVTAGDAEGGIAPYANRGSWIDAMGPGVNVIPYLDRTWYGSGTSFATSWVSGWAAGYMAGSGTASADVTRQTLTRWRLPAKVTR